MLIQRVSRAAVRVEGKTVGEIGRGMLVLLGVGQGDGERECRFLAEKAGALRIFADEDGKMNRSIAEAGGAFLVVSQFTLYGDARKGRRPDYTQAAPPECAEPLYQRFCGLLREAGHAVATGIFGAMMDVELVNDGPVTIWLEKAPDAQG